MSRYRSRKANSRIEERLKGAVDAEIDVRDLYLHGDISRILRAGSEVGSGHHH
jgi:hypothetical protein